MSGAGLWVLVAGMELLALLCAVLGIAWWRNRRQRSRDRHAVQALVAKLREGRAEREAAIRDFLRERFGLADQALEAAAVPIAKEELRLYQAFANLYLARDAGAVAGFNVMVEGAVAPYWQLQGSMAASAAMPEPAEELAADPGAAVEPGEDPELDILRDENRRLSEELQITMNTMSRMLAEYSTMFKATAEAVAAEGAVPASGAAGEAAPTPEAAAETAAFDEPVAADAPTADAAQQPVGVAEDTDRALAELEGMLDDIDESNPDSQPGAAAPATEKATG